MQIALSISMAVLKQATMSNINTMKYGHDLSEA